MSIQKKDTSSGDNVAVQGTKKKKKYKHIFKRAILIVSLLPFKSSKLFPLSLLALSKINRVIKKKRHSSTQGTLAF